MKIEEVKAVVKTLKLQKLLEKVEKEVEIQKEFLGNLISFDASYELRADLFKVDPNGHDPLTSLVLRRGGDGGGGGRVVVVVIAMVVVVDVGSGA
nr:hypothetical protein [Tanacetum cinerariifolium]